MKITKLKLSQCHESHPDYAGMWFVEYYQFVWSAAVGSELDELGDFAGPFAHRGTAHQAMTSALTVNSHWSEMTDAELEVITL
jgi:hypothetical protein